MPETSPAVAPKKRGPNTAEGKARSRMNAVRHGLRAREFGILPEEDQGEWAEHVRDLRAGYGPVDATEEKLVTAIAMAMWKEIRADRVEAEVMAEIPPCRPGRSHRLQPIPRRDVSEADRGTDMQEPRHALSLGTAIRYATAASMATQRAQRAFLEHRKAKRAGLILPATESEHCTNDFARSPSQESAAAPAEIKDTKEFSPRSPLGVQPPANDAGPTRAKYTNDFPPSDPLAALRDRIGGLPDIPGLRPLAERRPAQLSRPRLDGPPRPFGPTLKHASAMPPFVET